jgi:hypothetical protein
MNKILQIFLTSTTLFSCEIDLGKSSNSQKELQETKSNLHLLRDNSKQYCHRLIFTDYKD